MRLGAVTSTPKTRENLKQQQNLKVSLRSLYPSRNWGYYTNCHSEIWRDGNSREPQTRPIYVEQKMVEW